MTRRPTGPGLVLGIAAGVGTGFLVLPLVGLAVRAPWAALPRLLTRPEVLDAVRVSLVASFGALAVATVLGVPLAWVLGRVRPPGTALLRALVVLPMVLPPVVGGVALLATFGRRGVLGGMVADLTGAALPFTTAGTVVAGAFVAMPFLVLTLEAGLRGLDQRYEQAAATLGAGPLTRFRRVSLPLVAPSLAAGMALTWARALGEFGATITFAGNLPGTTRTLPLAVYLELETDPGAALLLSVVLALVSVLTLLTLRSRLLGAP